MAVSFLPSPGGPGRIKSRPRLPPRLCRYILHLQRIFLLGRPLQASYFHFGLCFGFSYSHQ